MKKCFFVSLPIVFALVGVALYTGQSEASVSEFVDKYLDCTAPERFADAPVLTPLKAKRFFSSGAKIHVLKDSVSPIALSVDQYLRSLSKLNFIQMVQHHILVQPRFEILGDEIKVAYVEGYLEDGYAEISETNMIVKKGKGKYRIKEISQKYRSPLQEELEQIKKLSSPSNHYDPEKGLGARYLGGGHFNSSTAISPDNKKIVFTSLKDESSELYIMKSDGSSLERLTTSPYWEVLPLFTPDGQHIIFLSDHESYQGEPYILKIANDAIERFLPQMRNVRNITYSPDGSVMVFTATQGVATEIFIRDCASMEICQLTRTGHEKIALAFSIDGKNLFFSEQWYEYDKNPPRSIELFAIKTDGNDIRQLTNDRNYKVPVAYTTDKQLFFIQHNKDYDNELWVMENDDSTKHLIISAVNGMNSARLMPDESAILFVDDRNLQFKYDVFSINLRHSETVKRITNLGCYISDLSMSKDGRFITLIAETSDSSGSGKGKIILFDFANGSQQILGKNY
ncbi:MAG: hypothetical protein A2Y07_11500 [Planctomycetes bacterium GWF2_50_10]|nr:MAG: hypothetical protein A2Y07_11500 [Planctomycetes bacterium GWF2_50_10]